MYDSATTSWAGNGAIVVNIHDPLQCRRQVGANTTRSMTSVKDDVNVMKYFIEKYDITGPVVPPGPSGTNASAQIIKALAGAGVSHQQRFQSRRRHAGQG